MRDKIKICFILSHLPQGGAERQTINLIRLLDPARFDITLLLYANRVIFYREIHDLPVRLISRPVTKGNKIIKNLAGALFLRRILIENNFDILHTLLFHNGLWVRLLAPGKYKNLIVYSIRNSISQSSLFERAVEKLLAANSFVVTNSKHVMAQYLKIVNAGSADKVRTIYNGIDIERFSSNLSPELNDTIIIGTVGRQTYLKNQIQVLRVVKDLIKDNTIHFYIIGDADQNSFNNNTNYIRDNGLASYVTIMDSQKNIENYYKKFNIFILPSISESCPNVLFEAMLARCLCIVSAGANQDQFIHDGHNGFVYDGTDEMLNNKLRMTIKKLKSSDTESLKDNGQKYVSENYSVAKMARSYVELYDSML